GVLDLVSWSPTSKHDFIRLVPVAITGRRFPRHLPRTLIRRGPEAAIAERGIAQALPMVTAPADTDPEHGKPHPIPHFAPLPH
ncbi:MAG TPA: hypothetical protein VFX99_02035, partial [Microbacterium sp.]|nr:hypothetical protein [Microbacterium sp.]